MEEKSQHFSLSKASRDLSIKRITRLSEQEAFDEFVAFRFADSGGQPVCVHCDAKKPYFIRTRRKWRCSNKACQRQFSPTTGTPLASRKLAYRDILLAIAKFSKAPKGMSAIRLMEDLEVDYKTAFVLLHKLREMIAKEQHSHQLRGTVEIDGGYNGGHVRPKNNQADRVDRRSTRYSKDRKCVTVMRERWGRTRAFICSESDGAALVPSVIMPGSRIVADENVAFNRLHGRYEVLRVNHSKHYAAGEASTNWAESYFARLDRSEKGVYHRIAGRYFDAYADEMTWREDTRRETRNSRYEALCRMMMRGGVSRQWKGYWQRRKEAA